MRESIADILDREHRARMARNRSLVDDWCDDGGVIIPVTPLDPTGDGSMDFSIATGDNTALLALLEDI